MQDREILFIVNPKAGVPGASERAVESIEQRCRSLKLPYRMLLTKGPGQAGQLVLDNTDSEKRYLVFACGGDGTLNEVVSGAVYRPNIAVSHIPFGTGNDFLRLFGDSEPFRRLEVLDGYDLLESDIISEGEHFCLNVCCMGFDARVADKMTSFRGMKRLHPSLPYNIGVVMSLLGGLSRRFIIEADGERFEGNYALVTLMNGRYYGGGFNPTPYAMPNDGLMELVMVKSINIFTFMKLIGHYARGDMDALGHVLELRRVREAFIQAPEPVSITYDGEMSRTNRAHIKLLPCRLTFAVPRGMTWKAPAPLPRALRGE